MLLPRARCLPLLESSSSCINIHRLKQIHAHMIGSGLLRGQANALSLSLPLCKLVESYFAVSAPDHARLLLLSRHAADEDPPDISVWNTMIRCCPPEDAFPLYAHHSRSQTDRPMPVPDNHTFTYLLGACARSHALQEGKQLHAQIIKTCLPSLHVAVQTTCIHFYASCRDIQSARRLFDEMPIRTSATWNAMIAGYCLNCRAKEAAALFREVLSGATTTPTDRTLVVLLSACSRLGEFSLGRSVHAYICKTLPYEGCVFFMTGLVDMYSKCGCLGSALQAFNGAKKKNVLTWSAMVAGLAVHGQGKAALELLDAMEDHDVAPNAVTFTCLLSACCHAGLVEEGLHLFEIMNRIGITPQIEHYSCVVDLFGRAGMVEEACAFISKMPVEPDAVLWRALLSACKIHGHIELGEEIGRILLKLEQGGSSSEAQRDCEDYVALSNVYASAERWADVWKLRETMKNLGVKNKPGSSQCN